ncbi:MAG: hypothetical protein NVS4B9_04660 [Ktedonobacteraceae bacterium]
MSNRKSTIFTTMWALKMAYIAIIPPNARIAPRISAAAMAMNNPSSYERASNMGVVLNMITSPPMYATRLKKVART